MSESTISIAKADFKGEDRNDSGLVTPLVIEPEDNDDRIGIEGTDDNLNKSDEDNPVLELVDEPISFNSVFQNFCATSSSSLISGRKYTKVAKDSNEPKKPVIVDDVITPSKHNQQYKTINANINGVVKTVMVPDNTSNKQPTVNYNISPKSLPKGSMNIVEAKDVPISCSTSNDVQVGNFKQPVQIQSQSNSGSQYVNIFPKNALPFVASKPMPQHIQLSNVDRSNKISGNNVIMLNTAINSTQPTIQMIPQSNSSIGKGQICRNKVIVIDPPQNSAQSLNINKGLNSNFIAMNSLLKSPPRVTQPIQPYTFSIVNSKVSQNQRGVLNPSIASTSHTAPLMSVIQQNKTQISQNNVVVINSPTPQVVQPHNMPRDNAHVSNNKVIFINSPTNSNAIQAIPLYNTPVDKRKNATISQNSSLKIGQVEKGNVASVNVLSYLNTSNQQTSQTQQSLLGNNVPKVINPLAPLNIIGQSPNPGSNVSKVINPLGPLNIIGQSPKMNNESVLKKTARLKKVGNRFVVDKSEGVGNKSDQNNTVITISPTHEVKTEKQNAPLKPIAIAPMPDLCSLISISQTLNKDSTVVKGNFQRTEPFGVSSVVQKKSWGTSLLKNQNPGSVVTTKLCNIPEFLALKSKNAGSVATTKLWNIPEFPALKSPFSKNDSKAKNNSSSLMNSIFAKTTELNSIEMQKPFLEANRNDEEISIKIEDDVDVKEIQKQLIEANKNSQVITIKIDDVIDREATISNPKKNINSKGTVLSKSVSSLPKVLKRSGNLPLKAKTSSQGVNNNATLKQQSNGVNLKPRKRPFSGNSHGISSVDNRNTRPCDNLNKNLSIKRIPGKAPQVFVSQNLTKQLLQLTKNGKVLALKVDDATVLFNEKGSILNVHLLEDSSNVDGMDQVSKIQDNSKDVNAVVQNVKNNIVVEPSEQIEIKREEEEKLPVILGTFTSADFDNTEDYLSVPSSPKKAKVKKSSSKKSKSLQKKTVKEPKSKSKSRKLIKSVPKLEKSKLGSDDTCVDSVNEKEDDTCVDSVNEKEDDTCVDSVNEKEDDSDAASSDCEMIFGRKIQNCNARPLFGIRHQDEDGSTVFIPGTYKGTMKREKHNWTKDDSEDYRIEDDLKNFEYYNDEDEKKYEKDQAFGVGKRVKRWKSSTGRSCCRFGCIGCDILPEKKRRKVKCKAEEDKPMIKEETVSSEDTNELQVENSSNSNEQKEATVEDSQCSPVSADADGNVNVTEKMETSQSEG